MHDMGIDLGGGDLVVAQKVLDGAKVGAAFQQMGGKAVAQYATTRRKVEG